MTILKLAIDSSAARQGAQEVVTAVDQVGRSAERAGRAVDTVTKQVTDGLTAQTNRAKDFGRTVEAVGEVTQVTGRIKLLGEEVRNLGSGMGSAASVGNLLAGSLVDIAQISGKVEGGFGGFVNLLKANPLLLAATVIGGIATAMSLFSDTTDEANSSLKEQIELQEQLRKTSVDLATQFQRNADLAQIGFPVDQQEQQLLRARRIAEVATSLKGQTGFQTFADLRSLTGLDEQQLRILAPTGGIEQQTQRFESKEQGTRIVTTDVGLTNEAARRVLLLLAENIKTNADFLTPGPTGGTGPLTAAEIAQRQAAARFDGIGPPAPSPMTAAERERYQMGFRNPGADMIQRDAELATEKLRELEEQLQSLKSLGQDVGSAIGSAFFSIVNGAANARQALAALLQQFVAIAQQRAIQGIANSVGNAFGASAQQQINNLQTPSNGGFQSSSGGFSPL
jgi:hypothetical protein